MSFITDLWTSIFTPGTTPTLIIATHGTFALLVITLTIFVFLSRSVHLINLLVISILLWGTLTWFIAELDKAKENTKDNEQLQAESTQEDEKNQSVKKIEETSKSTATGKSTEPAQRRSKKI